MDIGIDLGTTFSVVAVNGRVQLAPSYPQGIYLESCDVTIIPTPEGEPTFPSAIWEDPDNPGQFLVGYEALLKADQGDAPILFSKRKIGTAEPILMHNRTFLAREAAVQILRHLKVCAEAALGQSVDRAVVSHPAYFDRSQVEETRQAATEAGFDMSAPEQMVMEPVTAALAYTRTDKRDPLSILTYDLGGGTFDVAYLERRGGVISMKAFDGDQLLGGYNFDRELVHWLCKRLEAKGRPLIFDESRPQDRGALARLLRIAEATKIRLAEVPDDDARIEIRIPDLLIDARGRRISVLEQITRREFVGLIRPHLAVTVECCRRAIQKAGVGPEQVDEILLVGGSTYGPWVHSAIAEGFPGRPFKLFYPDLCVGAGAAIHAAMVLPESVRGGRYRLTLNVPAKSVLAEIEVIGQVLPSDSCPPSGHAVTLHLPAGRALGPSPLSADGRFRFSGVELLPDGPSRFRLSLSDPAGKTVLEHSFEVLYAPTNTDTTTVTTVLPKPLFLQTLEGLVPLAAEGAALPARCREVLIRDNDNPNIAIPIYQEDRQVGVIRIESIPREGGRGSRVEVEVVVTEKNQVKGKAKIVSPTGRLVRESPVHVTFDIPTVPELEQLTREFGRLQAQCAEVLTDGDDEQRKGLVAERAPSLIDRIEHFLEQRPLERQEVLAALHELSRVVTPPPDPLEPSKKEFLQGIAVCQQALDEMETNAREILGRAGTGRKGTAQRSRDRQAPGGNLDAAVVARAGSDAQKVGQYRAALAKMEQEGLAAHQRRDKKAWAAVNDNLGRLIARVQKRPDLDPPPILMKLFVVLNVDRERARLIERQRCLVDEGRLDDWESEVDRLVAALEQLRRAVMEVDDDQPRERVRAQLAVLMTQRLTPIVQDINHLGIDTHRR
jgi:molecular chaperone DnaK (HSP70)